MQVKAGLVPFIAKLREKGTPPDSSALAGGPFDTKAQVRIPKSCSSADKAGNKSVQDQSKSNHAFY